MEGEGQGKQTPLTKSGTLLGRSFFIEYESNLEKLRG